MTETGAQISKRNFLAAFCLLLLSGRSWAATLDIEVENSKGGKVKDAVVYALPDDPALAAGAETPEEVMVDQVDKEFVPYVTAVYLGANVLFPNSDNIRHHVYSFSEAKQFEIPLYSGTPANPITLDKEGEVALGCNIHDWMKAYVFVSETPFFGITGADGRVTLKLPSGEYEVRVWHPNLRGMPEETGLKVTVARESEPTTLTFSIREKKLWKPWRAPGSASGGYR